MKSEWAYLLVEILILSVFAGLFYFLKRKKILKSAKFELLEQLGILIKRLKDSKNDEDVARAESLEIFLVQGDFRQMIPLLEQIRTEHEDIIPIIEEVKYLSTKMKL